MPIEITLKTDTTSLSSVARQYSASREKGVRSMEEQGANHLYDISNILGIAYECINPGGLVLKKAELHRINVATRNELYELYGGGSSQQKVPQRIEVQCIMNNEVQTLVYTSSNGTVAISLGGQDSKSIPLDDVHSFKELYEKLDNELELDGNLPEWLNEDGKLRPEIEIISYCNAPPDESDKSDVFDGSTKRSRDVYASYRPCRSESREFDRRGLSNMYESLHLY